MRLVESNLKDNIFFARAILSSEEGIEKFDYYYKVEGKKIISALVKTREDILKSQNKEKYEELIEDYERYTLQERADILKQIFLEDISKEDIVIYEDMRMKNGWTIDNMLKEHFERPNKRLVKVINRKFKEN